MTGCAADVNADGKEFDFVYSHCLISKTLYLSLEFNNTGTGTATLNHICAAGY